MAGPLGRARECGGMADDAPIIRLLRYCQEAVEQAMARGDPFVFEDALPTMFDEFFTLADELGVLDGIERLTDPRRRTYVPLPVIGVIVLCRFLYGLGSFRGTGKVLLRNHVLLRRLGVAPEVLAKGGYYQCQRAEGGEDPESAPKPFDEESITNVLARLDVEELNGLLVRFVEALRRRHPRWFQRGLFIMDSNHFRPKGSEEEYKWCCLMMWTPYGMIPVAAEFSATKGEGTGEKSVGPRLMQRVFTTYGDRGFVKLLLMDTGYLDGAALRWLYDEHGVDWVMDPSKDMLVTGGMLRAIEEKPQRPWVRVEGPKLDWPKEQLPQRHVMWVGERRNFTTYGLPVNGCVIRDTYPPSEKYPEGEVVYQCLVTSRMDWKAKEIHDAFRMRWCIENTFGVMTTFWKLGQWEIGRFDVYRATILFMALTFGLLVVYLRERQLRIPLRGIRERLERQAQNRVLVFCGGAVVSATPAMLNAWVKKGLLSGPFP